MNKLAQQAFDFLQEHKISSHAIVVGVLGFFGLYTGDKQVFDYVNGLFAHYPTIIAGLGTASAIYLRYSQSQKRPNV